ncbi:MAG TPA: hypothetical protein VKA15_14070 [Isosphaeraceae bacterium]|nr:hypothetical protein [Isosphaeraceae bacterium]
MSFTHVQGTGNDTGAGGAASLAKAYGSNVAAGDLLLCGATTGGGHNVTVTDSQGNAWQKAVFTGKAFADIWWTIAGSSAACTVTVTPTLSDLISMTIDEYSFAGGTIVQLTSTNTKNGSGTTQTAGNLTIGTNLVYCVGCDGTGAGAWTASTGFTLRYNSFLVGGTHYGIAASDNVAEATNPINPGFTTTNSITWNCSAVAFAVSTPGAGSWTHVQGVQNQQASGATITAKLPNNPTVGNFLVIGSYYEATTGSASISDGSNVYTLQATKAASGATVNIWTAPVTTGAALTFTFTPGSNTYCGFTVDEYAYPSATLAFDHFAVANGSSTTPSSGTVTVSGTDLLYGFMTCGGGDGNGAGANFCLRGNAQLTGGYTYGFAAEDQFNVTSNAAATFILTPTDTWVAAGISVSATALAAATASPYYPGTTVLRPSARTRIDGPLQTRIYC